MKITRILFLPILLLIASCNSNQKKIDTWNERLQEYDEKNSKAIEIPQGTFTYELYFAEFGGRLKNLECTVTIKGNKIIVVKVDLTSEIEIFNGLILKHKSGKWILADKESEANADEIGGCTEIPIIDFDKKFIEWC